MMNIDERNFLKTLPNTVRIYRGTTGKDPYPLSWSLSKTCAHWFANRFNAVDDASSMIRVGDVDKSDIIALFTSRGEQEVVVLPSKVIVQSCIIAP